MDFVFSRQNVSRCLSIPDFDETTRNRDSLRTDAGTHFRRITPYIYSHLGNCIGSNDVDRGRRLDSIRPSLLVLVILSLARMLQIGASQP